MTMKLVSQLGTLPEGLDNPPEAIFKIRQELNPAHELCHGQNDKKSDQMYQIQYILRNKPQIPFLHNRMAIK